VRTRQITIAFETPVSKHQLAEILKKIYGPVIIGEGRVVNGIPEDWILVENDKRGQ